MTKHFKSLLAATALGSMIAFGAQAEEPVRGGTLIHGMYDTPRHLNPAVQSGIATGAPGTQLFAAPLRYDEDWTPQPYLAESWEFSEDGLTMTLKLVKNATFHDGVPITSEDVAFSIKTVQENHPFKTMFAPVTSVDTPDAHTAVLNLSQPHPALLLAMSSQLLPIIPKHVYGDGQDIKTHPQNSENVVGSGPFKLVEFNRDQNIVLERYDGFFMEGRPYLDKLVYRIIKDPSSRAIGLENGELHMSTFENTVRNIARMKENPNLTVTSEGYDAVGALDWLAFNTGSEGPTSNKLVRQAIAYAIDKKFILNALNMGLSTDAKTGIHPGSPLYDDSVNGYDVDLDKANALLDEAGFAKGADGKRFSLTMDYGNTASKPQAEFVKASLSKVGIDVTVNSYVDFPTWAQKISNHDFDMTWDNVFNWGDPVIGVHRTYASNNIAKGVIWSNTQQYSNARVDELMDAGGKELDPVKRKAIYAEFQQIIAEDVPIYFMNASPYHTIYSNKVGNPPLGIWASGSPYDLVYLKE